MVDGSSKVKVTVQTGDSLMISVSMHTSVVMHAALVLAIITLQPSDAQIPNNRMVGGAVPVVNVNVSSTVI